MPQPTRPKPPAASRKGPSRPGPAGSEPTTPTTSLLGAHVSAAGGLWLAFDRAAEIGCETFQIFTKNKGAWAAKPLDDETIEAFRQRARDSNVKSVVTHASYLLNLASPDADLRAKSVEALRVELERCELLGIPYLVLHPGSHKDTSESAGLRRVTGSLNKALRQTDGYRVRVLLENSAGQGSSVCRTFESLGRLLETSREPDRLGVCLDTCHLFAAGYDLRSKEGYAKTFAELEEHFDLDAILCFHVNDSKTDLGSRVDRHEHIGRGKLGLEPFRLLLNDRRFRRVPMIFELPPEDDMLRVNLKALRKLVRA